MKLGAPIVALHWPNAMIKTSQSTVYEDEWIFIVFIRCDYGSEIHENTKREQTTMNKLILIRNLAYHFSLDKSLKQIGCFLYVNHDIFVVL